MALTGSWQRIYQEDSGETVTQTIYHPLSSVTASDGTTGGASGSAEEVEVTVYNTLSQSFDSVYVRIQGATIYYPGESTDTNYRPELQALYRVYNNRDEFTTNGLSAAIDSGAMDPIVWDWDTMTNPFEVAYDSLKTYPGFTSLIDC